MSVKVKGLDAEIQRITSAIAGKRNQVKTMAVKVSEDLLKKSRDNAPVREGTLIDSLSGGVRDKGIGNGFSIIVSAGSADVIYANRMHEDHYQAFPRAEVQTRRSKKLGHRWYKYSKGYRTAGGFWIDSAGNKYGRKYLTRALKDNLPRYEKAFAALGDKH